MDCKARVRNEAMGRRAPVTMRDRSLENEAATRSGEKLLLHKAPQRSIQVLQQDNEWGPKY